MTNLHFYDAANPLNVPSGVYASVYVNGFAWPQSQIDRMARVFHTSVEREAFWAKYARCIDVENGAALPEDVPAFIDERRAHGFDDATAYVNRSNWQIVYDQVKVRNMREPLWWVSTLDGTQEVELKVDNVVIARAWAVQYETVHGHDVSILHGINNFVKP